jgi:flagellar capping protein FliD
MPSFDTSLASRYGVAGKIAQLNPSGLLDQAQVTNLATDLAAKAARSANLSDLASAATAFANIKQAASETATGVVEKATLAEAQTGTDTTRFVGVDVLAKFIGYSSGTIADDNVATFAGLTNNKTAAVLVLISNKSGLFLWETVGGYSLLATGSALSSGFVVLGGTLTGTTGTDGNASISIGAGTDNTIYLENRLGGTAAYTIFWFGGR